MIVGGVVGLAMERLLIRHLYGRPLDSFIITWGVAILLREFLEALFGSGYKSIAIPAVPKVFTEVSISGGTYPAYRLVVMLVIAIVAIALILWYRRSNVRDVIMASFSNSQLAQLAGINTRSVAMIVFTLSAASASAAGALIALLRQ